MTTFLLTAYIETEKKCLKSRFKVLEGKFCKILRTQKRKFFKTKFFKFLELFFQKIEKVLFKVFRPIRVFLKNLDKPSVLENFMIKIKEKLQKNALKTLSFSVFGVYICLVIFS